MILHTNFVTSEKQLIFCLLVLTSVSLKVIYFKIKTSHINLKLSELFKAL